MKKQSILFLAFILTLSIVISACADTITIDLDNCEYEEVVQAIDALRKKKSEMEKAMKTQEESYSSEKSILLQSIPWHSNRYYVEKVLGAGKNYDFPLMNWEGRNNGQDERGYIKSYKDISVAGYSAELLVMYIYPVQNGIMLDDDEHIMLYMAMYTIKDIADVPSLVKEMKEKLCRLYGELYTYEGTSYITWKDKEGNGIRIRTLSDRIELIYFAADIDELLNANAAYVKEEVSRQEEMNQNRNQDNLDGL